MLIDVGCVHVFPIIYKPSLSKLLKPLFMIVTKCGSQFADWDLLVEECRNPETVDRRDSMLECTFAENFSASKEGHQ